MWEEEGEEEKGRKKEEKKEREEEGRMREEDGEGKDELKSLSLSLPHHSTEKQEEKNTKVKKNKK